MITCKKKEVPVSEVFPNYKWATVVSSKEGLKGVPGITAKDCGTCHKEHYKEWKQSTHANAFTDLQFQSELTKENSPKWLCLNCHIPVSGQRKTLVTHLVDGKPLKSVETKNPNYIQNFELEGVTCATCHLKTDSKGNPTILGIHGYSAPHPVQKQTKNELRSRCNDCHNITYFLNDQLVCYFQTRDEMLKTPLASENCGSCHMKETKRSIATGYPSRLSHRHYFPGSGVPKTFDLLKTSLESGYDTGFQIRSAKILGEKLQLEVQNTNKAHKLPTGDPERNLKITIFFESSEGTILEKKQITIGQTWEWSPKAKLLQDNRLAPNEIRKLSLEFPKIPEITKVQIITYHERLQKKTAEYMSKNASRAPEEFQKQISNLHEEYPFFRIIDWKELDCKSGKIQSKSRKQLLEETLRAKNHLEGFE